MDELIAKLDGFGRIQTTIESLWGTKELDEYLLTLLSDTRNGERKGFPPNVSLAILALQVMNLRLCGDTEPTDLNTRSMTGFGEPMWTLPKNF